MSQTPTQASSAALFAAEVARIRDSNLLGRATQPQRLFEFLVTCHASGRVPKELELAMDALGRAPQFDTAQDATVRVTAHKLRKRLDEFYHGQVGQEHRLSIPRGEYRLVLEPVESPSAADAARGWRRMLPQTRREWWATLIAGSLLFLVAALLLAWPQQRETDTRTRVVRAAALWAPLFADDRPIQLVLGDYYIFGERNASGDVSRLVRDFNINSRQDLENRFLAEPQLAERQADLNLGYLPTSSAQALREILPVVMMSGKPVTLTLASELDPGSVKSTHIVYVGYLSALGMLEEMVFRNSRYTIGSTYDQLIDAPTGRSWVSEAGAPHGAAERYRDYAYVASFPGSSGSRHVIIAGTRDTGLMQAAEIAADPARVPALAPPPGLKDFETLYEVQSVNGVNVESTLIQTSAITR